MAWSAPSSERKPESLPRRASIFLLVTGCEHPSRSTISLCCVPALNLYSVYHSASFRGNGKDDNSFRTAGWGAIHQSNCKARTRAHRSDRGRMSGWFRNSGGQPGFQSLDRKQVTCSVSGIVLALSQGSIATARAQGPRVHTQIVRLEFSLRSRLSTVRNGAPVNGVYM